MKTDVAVTLIKPPAVRQAELQEVIDLQNRIEILAADIRRRLESGAVLESGALGASAAGADLQWHAKNGGIDTARHVDVLGLEVGLASRLPLN